LPAIIHASRVAARSDHPDESGDARASQNPSISDTQWTIASDTAGLTLVKFLARGECLESRARAVAAIERGKVFLNDAEAGAHQAAVRLRQGDRVRVWMDRPGSAKRRAIVRSTERLRVLYEDDTLLVIDKPAGLLAVPLDRKRGAPSVYDLIEAQLRSRKRRPFVVHRIDRDTSGVVLFAKDARTQQHLRAQFKRHEPERVYLAVVYGHPRPASGTWRDHLVWDATALIQKETHSRDPRGKEAISEYRVLETFESTSLVEVRLQTGKRNQIRLQARLRGHTLVGEQRYVFGPEELRPIAFHRQALHARQLSFRHPLDGRLVQFESPLPADLEALLKELRRR
jgi:23S rRNA pseudouridine1911/1915/1917 synthase